MNRGEKSSICCPLPRRLAAGTRQYSRSCVPSPSSVLPFLNDIVLSFFLLGLYFRWEKCCHNSSTIYGKTQALLRSAANKDGLLRVEADIKRIMDSLNIPILTNIRRGQRRGQETLEAIQTELAALAEQVRGVAGGEQATWRLLGRVRLDKLKEGGDVLGQGTFGIVKSGTYMGQEVAIKKAMGPVGDPAVLSEFRWVALAMLETIVWHTPWKGAGPKLTPHSNSPCLAPNLLAGREIQSTKPYVLVLRRHNYVTPGKPVFSRRVPWGLRWDCWTAVD